MTKLLLIEIENGTEVQLSPVLNQLFNMSKDFILKENFSTYIPHQLYFPAPQIGIVLDITSDSIVNSGLEKCVKIVTLNNSWMSKPFSQEFQNVEYHPVKHKNFSQIQMNLAQFGGTPVNIEFSDIKLCLHFVKF